MGTEDNAVTKNSRLRDQLRQQTGKANVSLSAAAMAGQTEGDAPLLGDLYVLAQTADWPIEWAIVDSDPPRLLTIPADTSSLVGSSDVAVPASASRGSLSLRCKFGVWVDSSVFDQAAATGSLDSDVVQAARRRWAAIDDGGVVGSLEEREVDIDSEYLDWVHEVLEPAHAALAAASAKLEPSAQSPAELDLADVVPMRSSRPARRWSTFGSPMGLAASVLLVITLGLGRQLMLSEQAQESAVQDYRQQVAELEQDQQRTHDSYRRDLARIQSDLDRTAEEHQRQIAQLEASQRELGAVQRPGPVVQRPKPVVNLPFVVLSAGQTRGGGERLEVPSDAELFMLILRLDPSATYSRYRLEVRRSGTARVLWSSDQLSTRGAELTVALPRSLLSAGEYDLALSGLSADQQEDAGERGARGTDLGVYALTLEVN